MDKLNIIIMTILVLIIVGFLFSASNVYSTNTIIIKKRNPYYHPPPHYNPYKAQYYNQYYNQY
jgi:hypothetical protein